MKAKNGNTRQNLYQISHQTSKSSATFVFFCTVKYTFPQYRKLSNGLSYYKISSETHLLELQRIGSRWMQYEIMAKILPERILIQDILEKEGKRYEDIEAQEFERLLQQSK